MIDNKRNKEEWKIQLVLKINFISSKNFNDKNIFNSILRRYQKGLQESMRGSDFVFYHDESLNYIFHKIDLKRSGSYIDRPKWIKNKKATINPQNEDDDNVFNMQLQLH